MGSFIIKVDRDEDLYLEWSTIVEAPTAVGTRAGMLKHLSDEHGWRGPSDPPEVRLARADETGTSMRDCKFGGWDDTGGEIYMQQGFLPRSKMAEFARRLLADVNAEPTGLLEPFADDEPDDEPVEAVE